MKTQLTAENVNNIFDKLCFTEEEISNGLTKNPDNYVIADGLMTKVGLNKERLQENKQLIIEMLSQFPKEFYKGTGNGWTFLNFCQRDDGFQWSDLHQTMDKLLMMGLGLGIINYTMPRELWSVLPGGMPYIQIDLNKQNSNGLEK